MDGCTLQSSPESGGRAGYDGYKRRKGSKVHIAVDTLGHLLAVKVTAADEQERAQVGELAEQIQQATGENVHWPIWIKATPVRSLHARRNSTASSWRWSSSRRPGRLLCCCQSVGWWNAVLAGRRTSRGASSRNHRVFIPPLRFLPNFRASSLFHPPLRLLP